MAIRAYLYDAEGKDREVPLTQELVSNLSPKHLLWVDLTAFDENEVRQVAEVMELPRASVEHLLQPNRRPRLDNYGKFCQININTLQSADKDVQTAEVDFVVGSNVVVTVHQKPIDFLKSFDRRVVGDSQIGELDAPAFLAALLDWHITAYFRSVEKLEAEIDQLDESALGREEQRDLLVRLIAMRQQVSHIRRTLTPHREVFAALVRPDLTMISSSDSTAHFSVLHERLERAIEAVENARELLVGSFDIYATQTALRTNDTIRILTVVSVVLLPTGVIAGIMGMSMKARVYNLGESAFWGTLALMALVGLTMIVIARRRRWI